MFVTMTMFWAKLENAAIIAHNDRTLRRSKNESMTSFSIQHAQGGVPHIAILTTNISNTSASISKTYSVPKPDNKTKQLMVIKAINTLLKTLESANQSVQHRTLIVNSSTHTIINNVHTDSVSPDNISIAVNSSQHEHDHVMHGTNVKPVHKKVISSRKYKPLSSREMNYFKKRESKVNEYLHNFTITSPWICSNYTYMIILVNSDVSHTRQRNAIRQTWGDAARLSSWPHKTITKNISIGFVLGLYKNTTANLQVMQEQKQYQDLIQGTFLESYFNMTLKSLLAHKWIFTHCPLAKYFLKSDDDMYINIPLILRHLVDFDVANVRRSITGPVCPKSPVMTGGKWEFLTIFIHFLCIPSMKLVQLMS